MSICPNEDFLPAVPNPEDIIWDDIGSNTKDEQSEKVGEEEVPATDQGQSESSTESNDVVESQEESGSSVTNAESVVTTSDTVSKTEDSKNKVTSDGDEA
jgi:hypothetical protein